MKIWALINNGDNGENNIVINKSTRKYDIENNVAASMAAKA
jgi:hypothetical protein